MSLFDRFRRDADRTTADRASTDGGSTSTDPFDADFDDMSDGLDEGAGDDGFDTFDDSGDEYATEELESRIDELETELASVSSTMNTLKSENEEIIDAVDGVEENVRKLLDIYEMVTRGINPFTDDVETGSSRAESLGLFDAEETTDDDPNEDEPEADDPMADDAAEDGTSFDDLKAEYDADETDQEEESDQDIDAEEDETTTVIPAIADGDVDSEGDGDSEVQFAEHTLSDSPNAEKPYLRGLPDGYVADLLVLEWLEYLVDAAGNAETERAIEYYETIEWIDETGAERLRAFMSGFESDSDGDEDRTQLSIAEHTESLRYICQLASSTSAPVVLEGWETSGNRSHQ